MNLCDNLIFSDVENTKKPKFCACYLIEIIIYFYEDFIQFLLMC